MPYECRNMSLLSACGTVSWLLQGGHRLTLCASSLVWATFSATLVNGWDFNIENAIGRQLSVSDWVILNYLGLPASHSRHCSATIREGKRRQCPWKTSQRRCSPGCCEKRDILRLFSIYSRRAPTLMPMVAYSAMAMLFILLLKEDISMFYRRCRTRLCVIFYRTWNLSHSFHLSPSRCN